MLDEQADAELRGIVRTGQIIVLACGGGVLMFAAYVLLAAQPRANAGSNLISWVSVALAVAGVFAALLIGAIVAGSGLRRIADGTWASGRSQTPAPETDAGRVAAVYQTRAIIRVAFFEGPSFLGLFAYMTEGHLAGLIVAAVMLVGLLSQFPTPGRVAAWVETQLRWIEDTRQLRRS